MAEDLAKWKELTRDVSDFSSMLKAARRAEKQGEGDAPRIAVLGTNSIQLIVSVLRALLLSDGQNPRIYEGEYDGIRMDVLDSDSPFYRFAPDYVVLLPELRDIPAYPELFSSEEETERMARESAGYFLGLCERIHEKLPAAQILLSDLVLPFSEQLGNLEANCGFSRTAYLRRVNALLGASRPGYVTILAVDALASYVGKKNWFDETAYFLNKSGFSLQYIGNFCDLIRRQLRALSGKVRKCLVLDLDNTLWGGTVGDLGYDGINLDPNDAVGEAFLAFQRYILLLKKRGVILAVCSKNEEDLAREAFEKNRHMVLCYDDISCFVANWNDKASNLRLISEKLNIGLDSLVFFDDNPTERAIVEKFLPEVAVVDVPEDPALYVRALDRFHAFDWLQLTKEDISRSKSYADNRKREELLQSLDDYGEYLRELAMKASFRPLSENSRERFSQLINKSNQFNLRTRRYSEAQIGEMMEDPAFGLYTVSLRDRFSDYGIIACIILRSEGKSSFIDSWVMSCRVLKKGVENYTFQKILSLLEKQGISKLRAEYLPTKKNRMVEGLLPELGFSLEGEDGEGGRRYRLELPGGEVPAGTYYIEEE